jgi:DNA gyrase subunit A
VINIDANDRNGDVIGMKLVADDDELMLITEKGILIRTRVNEIRETGRNAAGVRLIKIDEGDKLVAMAKLERDEEESEPAPDQPSASSATRDRRTAECLRSPFARAILQARASAR